MIRILVTAALMLVSIMISGCSEEPETEPEAASINVFVCDSVSDTVNEIIEDYSIENPYTTVILNSGSPQSLKTQISAETCCDVYITAPSSDGQIPTAVLVMNPDAGQAEKDAAKAFYDYMRSDEAEKDFNELTDS